jgi:hypothetical protein
MTDRPKYGHRDLWLMPPQQLDSCLELLGPCWRAAFSGDLASNADRGISERLGREKPRAGPRPTGCGLAKLAGRPGKQRLKRLS